MDFDDEKLLTPKEYEAFARAYSQRQPAYIFVRLDCEKENAALSQVADALADLKSNLFALGGFLGTGALFNLTNKHIERLQTMFGQTFPVKKHKFVADKTKCFLNMLSLEGKAINRLLDLALCSSHSEEIAEIIKERTSLFSSLFQINGVISSFSR